MIIMSRKKSKPPALASKYGSKKLRSALRNQLPLESDSFTKRDFAQMEKEAQRQMKKSAQTIEKRHTRKKRKDEDDF